MDKRYVCARKMRAVVRRDPTPPHDSPRPKTRKDCKGGCRPCPFVGCRYHLFMEVTGNGSLQFPFGQDVAAMETMADTCALDVADRGAHECSEIAPMLDMSDFGVRLAISRVMIELADDHHLEQDTDHDELTVWEWPSAESKLKQPRQVRRAKQSLAKFIDSPSPQ